MTGDCSDRGTCESNTLLSDAARPMLLSGLGVLRSEQAPGRSSDASALGRQRNRGGITPCCNELDDKKAVARSNRHDFFSRLDVATPLRLSSRRSRGHNFRDDRSRDSVSPFQDVDDIVDEHQKDTSFAALPRP